MKNQSAFPTSPEKSVAGAVYGGMSLRDYFAAKAMQAYIQNPDYNEATHGQISGNAYRSADAMLSEREKVKP